MPPETFDESGCTVDGGCEDGVQSLFIIRHGDRWDYAHPEWHKTTTRSGDPPLSDLGHQQARETGAFLDRLLAEDGISGANITWLSSPFLRTLQTSNEAISQFQNVADANKLRILPESSVFEWDGKDGKWHLSLPPIIERQHYFPRLNIAHESLFVPAIPEPRSAFHARCDWAMSLLSRRYPFTNRSAIVIVTHAAACISLVRAATQGELSDVTPAAPCSVYKLTRRGSPTDGSESKWTIDAHDAPGGLNGHSAHLSHMGTSTTPWNHFGDHKVNGGYTGPPSSRFAPTSAAEASN